MAHTRALAVAALLRWRRRFQEACIALLFQRPSEGHVLVSSATWQRFEQQELRESTQALLPFMMMGCGHVALIIILGRMHPTLQATVSLFTVSFMLSLVVVLLAWTIYLTTWFSKARENSTQEWWWCISYQCTVISFCFLWALTAGLQFNLDVIAHRSFCLLFMFACMWLPNFIYLPLRYHMLIVTMQGCCVWIYFHWAVDFLKVMPILLGLVLPSLELHAFHLMQASRWRLFSLAEKEKDARLLSDTLKQTLRGVLNVTFDASCECDESGLVLHTSTHLPHLLGKSTSDLVDVRLQDLVANPMEAQRVGAFFQQVSNQKQEAASGAACPPALLETVLKCCGWQDAELNVKLCCVPLPTDCTVYDADLRGSRERFFLGLQTVQTPETADQRKTRRSDDERSQSLSSDEGDESESSPARCAEQSTGPDQSAWPQSSSEELFPLSQRLLEDAGCLQSTFHGLGDSAEPQNTFGNYIFPHLPGLTPSHAEKHVVFECASENSRGSSEPSAATIQTPHVDPQSEHQIEATEAELSSSAPQRKQPNDLSTTASQHEQDAGSGSPPSDIFLKRT